MDKIEDLKEEIDVLQNRIKALENRTIIEVDCKDCDGSGRVQVTYDRGSAKCTDCRGIGHTFALSPLEEK